MCEAFFNASELAVEHEFIVSELQKMFNPSSVDDKINVTRGYNMAFGSLSNTLLRRLNVELIDTLLKNCVQKGKDNDDAETRKEAIKSLVNVVNTLGLANIDKALLLDIVEVFYKALDDYAVDRRGDVGSWVREEAMVSLTYFVRNLVENEASHP